MEYEFIYKIDLSIKLSVMDLAVISALAQRHYSADCREAVGERGFITVMHQCLLAITDDVYKRVYCQVSYRELDTICKICEEKPELCREYKTILLAASQRARELNFSSLPY